MPHTIGSPEAKTGGKRRRDQRSIRFSGSAVGEEP
jgi:hypothetical protein